MSRIEKAKSILPLPDLMARCGLGDRAKKSAKCPFHEDRHNSFSVWRNNGSWFWKCHAGCGTGDEVTFLEKHKAISRGGAIKLFLEMAGVTRTSGNGSKPFDWQACVTALKPRDLVRLGNERWYSRAFCEWLRKDRRIGLFRGDFAFPVRNNGTIVPAHYRRKAALLGDKDDWFYFPSGVHAQPFIIGDLAKARQVHIGESQWDMLALADRSDLYQNQAHAFVATRGAGNAALCKDLVPEGVSVLAWSQNDKAGELWLENASAFVPGLVAARIPKSITKTNEFGETVQVKLKDLNDWTKAGASAEDLYAGMFRSELVEKPEKPELVLPQAFVGFDGFVGGDTAHDEPSEEAEPFPLHCLPSQLETMAKAVCATERVPESLVGCCALGILSASIGASLAVQSASNRLTRANIFLLASAESGSGKSETFRHLAKPFQQFETDRIERWREQDRPDAIAKRDLLEVDIKECKRQYAKERDNYINEEVKKFELEIEELEKRLHMPTLTCEDITSEKLADLLSKNDEQLASLSSDALSIVNILLGRYNKLDRTDESLYLKAFSGDPCVVHRMSRDPIFLKSPCLTALWLTQPDKLQSLLDERSLNEGGLIPRILACHTNCGPREIGKNPPSISISVEKAYAGVIFCLLETYRLAHESFRIAPTSEALRTLNDHHDAIVKKRREELRDVTSYAARWNEQAWRIAVCIHAGTHGSQAHEQPVSVETAQRAIALADWFAEEQLRILNAGRMQRRIERLQRLMELIVEQYNGKATLRALQRNNGFDPDETRQLAAQFKGQLVIEKLETGGRPSEIVKLYKSEKLHRQR
jgi:hypothetical protein